MIIQQNRDGLYVSELIADRYQIMESNVMRGSYFVYDNKKDDLVRGGDSSTVYYKTVDDALRSLGGATSSVAESKVEKPSKPAKATEEPPRPLAAHEDHCRT